MSDLFLQVVVSGLLIGGVYALLSIGLTMIFGVVRIINFAHGEIMMLAMYLTFWLHTAYGVDPYLSLVVVAPAIFALGVAIQRVVIQPILEAPPLMKVFATVGLYIALPRRVLTRQKFPRGLRDEEFSRSCFPGSGACFGKTPGRHLGFGPLPCQSGGRDPRNAPLLF